MGELLDAARLLASRHPDLRVRIVGRGPQYDALIAQHARSGLGERVRFLGDVSARALAVEYVNADVFCLPSVQEAFGIVFAEAMAARLPVVACHAAAMPEVVEDGRTGVLVNPQRPAELASAIERLIEDPDRRQEMGDAAVTSVERFDVARIAPAWLELLRA